MGDNMGWFNTFLTATVIGIGSNFDNCGVGSAYGSERIKFSHWVNAIVNTVGFCTALLGAYMGEEVSHYLEPKDAAWAACIVLCAIGLFFWYSAYVHPRVTSKGQFMKIQSPGLKQGIVLGLALSITNIASGFGATVANAATLWATVLSITIWGYIMIWLGNVVGIGVLSRILGKYSSLVAGFLLIVVGVHQII